MRQYLQEFKDFGRKGDILLLLMLLFTSAFGCLVIASATNDMGSTRFLIIQIGAIALGVLFYIAVSAIDLEFLSEHRVALVVFNTFLLALLLPFGTDNGTGNKSWLDFPFLPFNIQPAEICKITYILIMASVMASHQNRLSSIPSVFHMVLHLGLLVGMNMIMSSDAGVSLIFIFIFIGMTFAGGVNLIWFALAAGGITALIPFAWEYVLGQHQKNRIMILFDPSIDPQGINERYHTVQSIASITGGGMTGQGLFNGNRTQADALTAQHTDYIFSAIAEEMGYIGCIFTVLLIVAIIVRRVYVGIRSTDYMRRLVCFGAASALIFQLISNVGMCIGVTPVIGLTLPFISYGGSSIVTLYAMLGLVSGVHARPHNTSHERYIQPYR